MLQAALLCFVSMETGHNLDESLTIPFNWVEYGKYTVLSLQYGIVKLIFQNAFAPCSVAGVFVEWNGTLLSGCELALLVCRFSNIKIN